METILIDDCRIRYHFDGPEAAPVLLLSNSLGTNLDMWAAQIPAFARHFRVLRYDSRGHGGSGVPAGPYSIERLGRDAVGLLDALGIARAHFCGLSKGGMVGQWLGVNAPEHLDRLILANTTAYMGPASAWDARITAVATKGMAGIIDGVVERWFTPRFRASDAPAVDRIRAMLLATDPTGYAGCCAAIRDMDQRPSIARIPVPTLVIGGTEDPATPPAASEEIAGLVPGARLHMLPAAHLSNVEQPGLFTKTVLDFLL
jgi:3-oxoadipate enol-lactonase